MKRNTLRLLAISALAASGLFPAMAIATEPIPVVSSFSILGDLVQAVGGSRVKVITLAGPDADAHEFAPSPQHARAVLNARLFVINGLNFEPWAQKLAKSAGYKGETVVASNGVKPRHLDEAGEPHQPKETGRIHPDADPHAWQNPNNVVLYVKNIAAGLSKVDPIGAATYSANASAYAEELKNFDSWAKEQFATIPVAKRKVITSHDAFGYFAAHYQISFLAPEGVSSDAEPSAKHVAELIRQMKREKIRAVFVENMSSPKLMAQLSKDAGATVGATLYSDALSGPSEPGSSYLKMMRHNVTQLLAGMRLN